jgi:hypothetical protein
LPKFFRDFFLHTASVFSYRFPIKKWRDLQLIAVDGTGLRLPNESWLGDTFGWHQNQHSKVPSTRLLFTFDVLNNIILHVKMHPRESAEVTIQAPLIKALPANSVTIYDRGFASYAIPYLHLLYGTHCIVRVKTSFNPTVVDFLQSGQNELIVNMSMTERAVRSLRRLDYKVSRRDRLTYRLIRVDLPTGEVEVLLTTLLDRKRYHHKHFKGLYKLRWGVETSIFVVKSYFQAAVFSSYTLTGVEQDLWALFAMYNLQSMLMIAQEKKLQRINEKRIYNYQLNRNVGVGLIKRFIGYTFLDEIKAWNAKVHVLLDELIRHLEPMRPRPSRIRKRKIMRGTERHIYESNYKPPF